MGTPVLDRDNHISCRWDKTEQRYITLAEDWLNRGRKAMRYRELLNVLTDINEKTPDMLDRPIEVSGIVDHGSVELELTLTMGAQQRLFFIPALDESNAS